MLDRPSDTPPVILVIEDSADTLFLITNNLKENDYKVKVANNREITPMEFGAVDTLDGMTDFLSKPFTTHGLLIGLSARADLGG